MKRIYQKEDWIPILIIAFFSLAALISLLHPGIPLTHDGKDHVARIANFYTSLSERIFVPRWAGNLNWGYGHPVMMFLYPLPSYLASFFHVAGFNFSDSLKIVFASTFIASALAMYVWLRSFLGTHASLIGAVFYIYAPYRFVDLYVRGAIGEHVAFVFPPLVCLFVLRSVRKNSLFNLLAISFCGALLILSHNAISLMFLPVILGYSFVLFLSHKNSILWLKQFLFLGYGFLLSAFFWIPAFLEGKYTLRDIVTGSNEYASRFTNLKALLYGEWNYGITGQFTTQIGLLAIVWILIALFLLYKKRWKKESAPLLYWLIVLAASIFLTLSISKPVYEIFSTLQKFQFPWRFLSVTVFSTSVLMAITLEKLDKSKKKIAVILSLSLLFIVSIPYMRAKDYFIRPDSFYSGIYEGTTDTGESSPVWSIRFMEKKAPLPIEIIDGQGEIELEKRTSTSHNYRVLAQNNLKVLENTLYFPGWKVYVDDSEIQPEFQNPQYRGLLTFPVQSGNHSVAVIFQDTKIRKYSNLLSIFSLGFIIVAGFLYSIFGKKLKKYEIYK